VVAAQPLAHHRERWRVPPLSCTWEFGQMLANPNCSMKAGIFARGARVDWPHTSSGDQVLRTV